MIEFLFLDLDDTILDFRKAEYEALGRTLLTFGVEPEDGLRQRYHEINKAHWQMLERGEITRDKLRSSRFVEFFRELGMEINGGECARVYESNLSRGYFFLPGALETLEALKGRYRMFLASNGNAHVQHGRLRGTNLYPYFEKVFISQEMGFNKPAKEYFERCFAQIPGFAREKCLMVGDSLSSDILGGINAGIQTCWVNPGHKESGEIKPNYEIEALTQLPELLKGL